MYLRTNGGLLRLKVKFSSLATVLSWLFVWMEWLATFYLSRYAINGSIWIGMMACMFLAKRTHAYRTWALCQSCHTLYQTKCINYTAENQMALKPYQQ